MTIAERGLDGTTAVSHVDESVVECYNLDGIPLIEINKTHTTLSTNFRYLRTCHIINR